MWGGRRRRCHHAAAAGAWTVTRLMDVLMDVLTRGWGKRSGPSINGPQRTALCTLACSCQAAWGRFKVLYEPWAPAVAATLCRAQTLLAQMEP